MVSKVSTLLPFLLLFFLQSLSNCCWHFYSLSYQVISISFLFRVDDSFDHFLYRRHPGPFLVTTLSRHMKINIWRFYPKSVGFFVLILIVGFRGFNFLQWDDFSWIFILALGRETIEMGFGQHHPPLFPLLKMTRLLE